DLEKLVGRYGGTSAAVQASLLIAQIDYDQGKPADGLKVLDGAPTSGQFGASVIAMRAAGLEQDAAASPPAAQPQKFAEAAARDLEAADKAAAQADQHRYQADAARAYAAGGKKAEAEKLWRALMTSDDPVYSQEAQLRVGELTAKPATKG